jgi:hypothetical protein
MPRAVLIARLVVTTAGHVAIPADPAAQQWMCDTSAAIRRLVHPAVLVSSGGGGIGNASGRAAELARVAALARCEAVSTTHPHPHTHTQRERKGALRPAPPNFTRRVCLGRGGWRVEGGVWRGVRRGSLCMHGLGHGTWTRAQLDVVALHSYAGAEALGRLVGGYLATLRRAATADPEKERKTRLLVQEWGVSAPNATAQAAMFAAKAAQIAKHGVPSMYWALRPAADVRPSSRPFWRPLTEIYLCDVCSCHSEILRRNGRAGPRLIDAL